MSDYLPTIDSASSIAKILMAQDFYWSPVAETGPFGNEDGADSYAGFAEWRKSNKTENPKLYLDEVLRNRGYPGFDSIQTNVENVVRTVEQDERSGRVMIGTDAAIIAIAFGQLYLEGKVHNEFRELAKNAIRRQLIPQLLAVWGRSYKSIRESQLLTMLNALQQAP